MRGVALPARTPGSDLNRRETAHNKSPDIGFSHLKKKGELQRTSGSKKFLTKKLQAALAN